VGNVADPDFTETAVRDVAARVGAIDGLVNNAGITRPAMIEKMTLEQWSEVISVHLTGAFLWTQAVGRIMLAQGKAGRENPGSILNISSDAGRAGSIGQINYAAAKSGLLGMTMSAAREWSKFGVRTNSVCFGVVETPMTETIRGDKFRDGILARIPRAVGQRRTRRSSRYVSCSPMPPLTSPGSTSPWMAVITSPSDWLALQITFPRGEVRAVSPHSALGHRRFGPSASIFVCADGSALREVSA
jgi:NAD(P)-dependent dehydrogenase (short-subunit alcohol dehydrogenase family)